MWTHSLDLNVSLKILAFNPPSPHCNFQWPSLGQEWLLYYTSQGSKLRLIRSPMWLTCSPWWLNILVGCHLGDQISLWFRFKVKQTFHLVLLCFHHKNVPNRINKTSLPPNLYWLLSTIFSKQSILMGCAILWAASFTLYKLATKNLYVATIFLQLNLRIF